MQNCLESLQCIPIIKRLCIVNKDYLLLLCAHAAAHKATLLHTQQRHTWTQSSHMWTPWPVTAYVPVCLFAKAFVKCVAWLRLQVTGNIQRKDKQKPIVLPLLPSFPFQLGQLSHVQPSRVLHPTEEKKKKQSSVRRISQTRTLFKLAGSMVLQMWMWSISGWHWRLKHTQAHMHTLSHYYLHSLITITHLFTCPLMPARKMSCVSIVLLGRVCH